MSFSRTVRIKIQCVMSERFQSIASALQDIRVYLTISDLTFIISVYVIVHNLFIMSKQRKPISNLILSSAHSSCTG